MVEEDKPLWLDVVVERTSLETWTRRRVSPPLPLTGTMQNRVDISDPHAYIQYKGTSTVI